jgi:hypothetical protein
LKKYSLLLKIRFKFDHFNSFALSGLQLIFTRNEHLLRTTLFTTFSIGTQAQNNALLKAKSPQKQLLESKVVDLRRDFHQIQN